MDNGTMENFFGRLKVEMFYGERFESVNAFIDELKGTSPVQYRTHSLYIFYKSSASCTGSSKTPS